ncbi:MAG: cytochrome b [Marinobacter sp.]|uniref:cytochrome b n=1 Tax=Marinobacter sp. TaxID=50741 RepID=UPI00299CF17F|nr:cytochrome b [Marinobacter sp.]MDX1756483.1 cytochrome b [Marinobacter sp.]
MARGNTGARFGFTHILLHWSVALVVFGLFGLGYYMVDLGYYHPWYRTGPHIHRSIGLLLVAVMVFRVIWRLTHRMPGPLPSHRRWEVVFAHATHGVLYLLIFTALASGYLISTADGSAIQVFNWFQVPSVTGRVHGLEEIAGDAHYWSTWALVLLAVLHGLAAIKHHVIDRDETLRRMCGLSPRS